MPPKRRAPSPVRPSPVKKARQTDEAQEESQEEAQEEDMIQREFYPAVISEERCEQYNAGKIPRPIDVLHQTLLTTKPAREKIEPGASVVHWFKRDLRLSDNRALHAASELARKNDAHLIGIYLVSPQDYVAHVTSAARVDFDLRSLAVLKKDLAAKDIPLYVATVPDRKDVVDHILARCRDWGAHHLFCNMEYEVDELRREVQLIRRGLEHAIAVDVLHDDAVVPPGALHTVGGKQYSVYTPWYRAWTKYIHDHAHVLDPSPPPAANPPTVRTRHADLFAHHPIPSAPPSHHLDPFSRNRLASTWPAGEHDALARLTRFLAEKAAVYHSTRNHPAAHSTSLLSVAFASGTLAARTAIRLARAATTTTTTSSSSSSSTTSSSSHPGITCWISELAWRDFYRHVLAHWPYTCMSAPFKPAASRITWDHDPAAFARWTTGTTGFPLVDAAMRQCAATAYMHNRCRMVVASFLAKDLLLDWRRGERWFMEHLVDGDWASNSGGWGFAASVGVDPQPYFRVFNPVLQGERFDPDGVFIRRWVPELRAVQGRAVHDPYGRGAGKEAERAGYPRMMVDHQVARVRCLERYKSVFKAGDGGGGGGGGGGSAK